MRFPLLVPLVIALAAAPASAAERMYADEPLVDPAEVAPDIAIDLRYATPDNVVGEALYPEDMRCWVRASVAQRLRAAQAFLKKRGYGLKIWDAWRPPEAHRKLYRAVKARGHRGWVQAPDDEGSLHSWGVAVDATLVDANGAEVAMPSKFDEFSSRAARVYKGDDPEVAKHLELLQMAMVDAGFKGKGHEWWHFMAWNWREFGPVGKAPEPSESLH